MSKKEKAKKSDNELERQFLVETVSLADFENCDLNQLTTILNLFDLLNIPIKGQSND